MLRFIGRRVGFCGEPQVLTGKPRRHDHAFWTRLRTVLRRDGFDFRTIWPPQIVG
jgi:hypothetical protein